MTTSFCALSGLMNVNPAIFCCSSRKFLNVPMGLHYVWACWHKDNLTSHAESS